jgi:hypothetical protein
VKTATESNNFHDTASRQAKSKKESAGKIEKIRSAAAIELSDR